MMATFEENVTPKWAAPKVGRIFILVENQLNDCFGQRCIDEGPVREVKKACSVHMDMVSLDGFANLKGLVLSINQEMI